MLTFDRRLQRFGLRSGYLCSFFSPESRSHICQESRSNTHSTNGVSKHSCSFIPVNVLASPLGAMVLYCYDTATYYSANFDRVPIVDLRQTCIIRLDSQKSIHFVTPRRRLFSLSRVSPRDSFPIHCQSHSDNNLTKIGSCYRC